MSPKTSAEDETRIVKHVQDHPGLTSGFIGRALGLDPSTVRLVLIRLENAGQVRRETVHAPTRLGYRHLWYGAETEQ